MKTKAYLISAYVAGAVTVGGATLGMEDARGAIVEEQTRTVQIDVAEGVFAGRTQLQLANALCSEYEDDFDLSPGTCLLSDIVGWRVRIKNTGAVDSNGNGIPDTLTVVGRIRRTVSVIDGEP